MSMPNPTSTPLVESGSPAETQHPARWWHALPDGRLQCDLCPRDCRLHEGQRGLCFVRQRTGDAMVLTTWGRSSGFAVDPIEKKPLNHFLPGRRVFSFGTAGCNLACKFCQNWDISKSREMDRLMDAATPERIAQAARATHCASVAFTYNDPVVFAEYAMDAADACRALGVQTVAVTAGYMHAEPRREFYSKMDAANVDLKAFTEDFYFQHTGAHLAPVLETLQYIRHETDCWLELTTLLIPGHNDGSAELESLTRWVAESLGPEVPLHFTAFHPDYKFTEVPRTPPATLQRACAIARANGLRHVYAGNVHDRVGGTTICTGCGAAVIVRDWHTLLHYALDTTGHCQHCGTPMAGRFGGPVPQLGVPTRPMRVAMR